MIVTEYGDCTLPWSTFNTTDRSLSNRSKNPPAGDEFNPLAERDRLNRLNPYQDPKRGRITEVTSTAATNPPTSANTGWGTVTNSIDNNVLLNLSGPDSIIGRAVIFQD